MLSSFSKYSRRRHAALTALSALAVLATSAQAEITRETERFERKRVSAGEEVSRELACPRGTHLTGGFALYNLPDDAAPFVVTASYPLYSAWRVEIRNVSDGPEPLAFRIYALCSDQ